MVRYDQDRKLGNETNMFGFNIMAVQPEGVRVTAPEQPRPTTPEVINR